MQLENLSLSFPESPRWHESHLYFVDMYRGIIYVADATGNTSELIRWHNYIGGLGWALDGSLLFVDMQQQKIMQLKTVHNVRTYADLSSLTSGLCNDMLTVKSGLIFASSFGYDLAAGDPFRKTSLVTVRQDRQASTSGAELAFPNGMVIDEDRQKLVVAETAASRLSMFDCDQFGQLSNRTFLCRFEGGYPDGICIDDKGTIWVALINQHKVVAVSQSGRLIHEIVTKGSPTACAYCPEGSSSYLYVTTVKYSEVSPVNAAEHYNELRSGKIEIFDISSVL